MRYDILLVENDRLDQSAFTRLVDREALPYDYQIAASVRDARALLQAREFDAALVDFHLDDGSGFDLLDDIPANVAVIFITGTGSEETAVRALRAGASDYLIKDPDRIYLKFLPLTIERAVKQKRTERQLWTLSLAVMSSSDCIYVTDLGEHITFVNRAFCDTYGYEPDEIVGHSCHTLQARGSVPTPFAGTSELESFHQRKDGGTFPVAMSQSPVQDGRGVPFAQVVVVRDFTERRRAKMALRESEERYRSVVTAMAGGILLQDRAGHVRACNSSAERILGRNLGQLMNCRQDVGNWQAIREDGGPFPPAADPAELTLRTGEAQHQVIMGIPQPDAGIRWISVNTEPLWRHGEDLPIAVVSSFTDITQLRNTLAERDELIENLDSFAQTVAHDLKSPASVILGFAELLSSDFDTMDEAEIRTSLDHVGISARRMVQIVDALLLLASTSKKEDVPISGLNMQELAAETQARLQTEIDRSGATVTVTTHLPPVLGFAPWVEEMLVNYVGNAIKYGGQPPRIEVGASPAANGMIRFWVRDNGLGLTLEEQQQLFQPFVRLSQVAIDGHGLGLSIVQQIALRLGGSVGVSSQVGEGSEFSFSLPAARQEPVRKRAKELPLFQGA